MGLYNPPQAEHVQERYVYLKPDDIEAEIAELRAKLAEAETRTENLSATDVRILEKENPLNEALSMTCVSLVSRLKNLEVENKLLRVEIDTPKPPVIETRTITKIETVYRATKLELAMAATAGAALGAGLAHFI